MKDLNLAFIMLTIWFSILCFATLLALQLCVLLFTATWMIAGVGWLKAIGLSVVVGAIGAMCVIASAQSNGR